MMSWVSCIESCQTEAQRATLKVLPALAGVDRSQWESRGIPRKCGGVSLPCLPGLSTDALSSQWQSMSIIFASSQWLFMSIDFSDRINYPRETLWRGVTHEEVFNLDQHTLGLEQFDDEFREVVTFEPYARHQELLQSFWVTLQNYIEWKVLEALELGSNIDPEQSKWAA